MKSSCYKITRLNPLWRISFFLLWLHEHASALLLNTVCEYLFCAFVLNRSGGFFSKILKKRKEAQTPDNGELTLAQILNEKPPGGEGKWHKCCSVCLSNAPERIYCRKTSVTRFCLHLKIEIEVSDVLLLRRNCAPPAGQLQFFFPWDFIKGDTQSKHTHVLSG